MSACVICSKEDADKPTIYRGSPWCCGRHRKMATLPIPECWNQDHDHESPDLPGVGMFCTECLRPLHFNFASDNYFHDGGDDCFLTYTDRDPCRPKPTPKLKANKKRSSKKTKV